LYLAISDEEAAKPADAAAEAAKAD